MNVSDYNSSQIFTLQLMHHPVAFYSCIIDVSKELKYIGNEGKPAK